VHEQFGATGRGSRSASFPIPLISWKNRRWPASCRR
jgi:hypothetical protein